ncbi:MAG: preprotein translocase subunit SecY [Acidobacteriota bacterium]
MIDAFKNIFKIPDLRKRVLFTFFVLAIFRIGAQIPTPGINANVLQEVFKQYASGVLGFVNLFSGGAFARCTIFALGIMPYITAQIIFQLLVYVWPYLHKLQQEGGAEGRKKITQWTRYSTIGISIIHSLGIAIWVKSLRSPTSGRPVVANPDFLYYVTTVVILTTGAMFVMWLGEQITARGVGNGISLMIYAGIVVGLVPAVVSTWEQFVQGSLSLFVIVLLSAFMLAVVAFIVYFEKAQRKIPIQYARRIVGRRMVGGQGVYFPLKLNPAGVMSIIFAVSLLAIPQTIAQVFGKYQWVKDVDAYLKYGTLTYLLLYAVMIALFTYFYVSIVFNPEDLADNLKKMGGFIPGIRPGRSTSEYLDRSLNRLLFACSIYLVVVALLPVILISGLPLQHLWGIGPQVESAMQFLHLSWILKGFNLNFYFGGTSLLIVVGVAMDTVQQVESQLVMRHYEGFSRRNRPRGRRS